MLRSIGLACLLVTSVSQTRLPKVFAAEVPSAVTPTPMPAPDVAGKPLPPRTVERSEDGLFYVEATVNGTPVHFVVDSGASVVVLSAADAARAAVSARDGVSVETAGGTSAMHRAHIRQVVLAGHTLSDVDAAIVDRDLPVSLLGQSALSQLNAVTFKGDRLVVD